MVRRWSYINLINSFLPKVFLIHNYAKQINLTNTRQFFLKIRENTVFFRSRMLRRRHLANYFFTFPLLFKWASEYRLKHFFTKHFFTKHFFLKNTLILNSFLLSQQKTNITILSENLLFSKIIYLPKILKEFKSGRISSSNPLFVYTSFYIKKTSITDNFPLNIKNIYSKHNLQTNHSLIKETILNLFLSSIFNLTKSYRLLFSKVILKLLNIECLKNKKKVLILLTLLTMSEETFF